jgi:hypothetical protein
MADFVNGVGQTDSERNPNGKLRVKLPAKLPATAGLDRLHGPTR